ncbi:MAG TPA: EamA family transporter [Terracidiphilus sp.]|jgi:drug/metabolite transporter (DMT)-like permease
MTGSGSSAGLGLISAAAWGGSDFAGGFGARRAPAALVAVSGHGVSFLILLTLCLGLKACLPDFHFLLYAILGGFEGALALAIFYRALSMGGMGLTAALAGLLTALVPVGFSAIRYGLPTPFAAVGLAAGCAAIWLITRSSGAENPAKTGTPAAALWLGVIAGAGFGAQLIFFKLAGGGNLLWVMAAARAAGVTALLLALLTMPPKAPWRGFWRMGIVAGLLDTAGNLLYMEAARLGRLDAAAVICSLYPAGTILLASLVLHEHPTRRQWAGMALALAAVAILGS